MTPSETVNSAETNTRSDHIKGPNVRHIRFVGYTVAMVAVLADLVTKWWALEALADGRRIPILGEYLTFVLLYNPGAAFSLGDNATIVFTCLAFVFSVGLIVAIWRARDIVVSVLYALLLGGALGNLYDRLFSPPAFGRGHVVDFINYNGFFVGNVADIWIVLAVIFLLFYALRHSNDHSADVSTSDLGNDNAN